MTPDDPASHRRVREMFDRQLAVMTDEGIDVVIAETFNWVGEALIAAEAIGAVGLPAMVTMGPDKTTPIPSKATPPARASVV